MELLISIGLLFAIIVFVIFSYYTIKEYMGKVFKYHIDYDVDGITYVKSINCPGCGILLRGYRDKYCYDPKRVIYDNCAKCQEDAYKRKETKRLENYSCIKCKKITKSDYCPRCGAKCSELNKCIKCGKTNSTKHCSKCGNVVMVF